MRAHPIIDYPYRWFPMLVLALVLAIIQATLSWGYAGHHRRNHDHRMACSTGIPGLVCGGLRIHTPDKGHHGRSRNITLDCGQLHDL